MDTDKKLVKTTVRIPEHIIKDLKEAGKNTTAILTAN